MSRPCACGPSLATCLAAGALGLLLLTAALAIAGYTATIGASQSIATGSISAPTGVTSAYGSPCVAVFGPWSVQLTWASSTSTRVTGYKILRSTTAGGPYAQVGAEVTPRTATTYTDATVSGTALGTRYYYVVSSTITGTNWTADATEVSKNVLSTCL